MTRRTGPNRAICDGDRVRSGIGDHHDESSAIRTVISEWSSGFIRKFLTTCKSAAWREEAVFILTLRERVSLDIQILNSKRARRRCRRRKAQLF